MLYQDRLYIIEKMLSKFLTNSERIIMIMGLISKIEFD